MSYQLSRGILQPIVSAGPSAAQPRDFNVQVTEVKPMPADQNGGRVKLTISDGETCQLAMLSRQAAQSLDVANLLYAILLIKEFTLATSNGVPVFILIEQEIIARETGVLFPHAVPAQIPTAGAPAPVPAHQSYMQQAPQYGKGNQTSGFTGQQQMPQQHQQGGGMPTSFHPIASLNPYHNRWTIKARVMSRGDLKTFIQKSSQQESCLFSVDLCDDSGEIRATLFGDTAKQYYDQLKNGTVFIISKGQVKPANKRFNHLNNEYELTLDHNTIIQQATDDAGLPKVKYSFADIASLKNAGKDDIVDVIGIVMSTGETSTIQTRQGKDLNRRSVTLVDTSGMSVEVTLWAEKADNPGWSVDEHPVVAIKGARVGDYRGINLGTMGSSRVDVDPHLPEAEKLRGWYERQGGVLSNIQSLSDGASFSAGAGDGGSWEAPTKFFGEIKDSSFGMEKPMTFNALGRIALIKHDSTAQRQPWYDSCPSGDCKKGVQEAGPGTYYCAKCNKNYPNKLERYILGFVANDHTGSLWMTAFNDEATSLLGVDASTVASYQQANPTEYDAVFNAATFKLFNFKVSAKQEAYNDELRMKYTVKSMSPVNYAAQSRARLEQIKAYGLMA